MWMRQNVTSAAELNANWKRSADSDPVGIADKPDGTA
jgi:hypothetical protein